MKWSVSSYAAAKNLSRDAARSRLERLVENGEASKRRVTEVVSSNRWGNPCRVLTTFDAYELLGSPAPASTTVSVSAVRWPFPLKDTTHTTNRRKS